jgi:Arc/MetJ-type ribon-helix-helix transcriptional regulator
MVNERKVRDISTRRGVILSAASDAALQAYWHDNRFASEAEAIRSLLRLALAARLQKPSEHP